MYAPVTKLTLFLQSLRAQLRESALLSGRLLYVELLALDSPSVREMGQCFADGSELLLPLLKLSVVFKVCGG